MTTTLETRHWVTIGAATIFGAAGALALPEIVFLYPATRWVLPLLAMAWILDMLGSAKERRRLPWKSAGWLCLVLGTAAACWPLWSAASSMWGEFAAWRDAGWPVTRAARESLGVIGLYSTVERTAMAVAFGFGLVGVVLTVWTPLAPLFSQNERDRSSATGPWRARWMEENDVAHLARNKTGLPLALHRGRTLRYSKDDAKGWRGGHHLVVSGTRGGKGVSAVIPAILEHRGPVVALDIKGENFAVTRRHRQKLGRKAAVLNPFGIIEDARDQFNPLDYIRSNELSRDIDLVADGLVKPEDGDGAHFSEMGRQLVKAAIEVVVTQETKDNRNLVAVADLLLSEHLESTLEAWIENRDLVGHRPAQTAATMLRAGDRERGSIQTAVAKAFDWMQSDDMRKFLQRSSFRLDDLLNDKLDLFIVVPLDQVDRQAVFMRLFINLVLGTVVRQDGRRKVDAPILLVLDEFVRLGRMEQVMNIANVAAGAGIEALFVTQDTGQVERAYGASDARSIFGSCITKRVFNVNDVETAEWAARHLGESTVYSQQVREGEPGNERHDLSYSEQGKKLMSPEQVMQMDAKDVLVLIGNRNPLMAKQNIYFRNKGYRGQWERNPLN